MSYQTAKTIKETITNIQKRAYVLPAIQREFVWKTDQIERLFDSLMRGYPIGTFLFWKIDKTKINEFQFYEFLRKYHERDYRHNQKANLSNDEGVTAILDGQQRMTSLYLALAGSYTYKKPYMARNNPNSYPERKLYLNLAKPPQDLEIKYDFRFLTEEDIEACANKSYWFPCHEILNFGNKDDIYDYLDDNNLSDTAQHSKDITKSVRNALNRFHDVIYKDGTISSYQEESEELDKVLQIFIRINSGGTQLSYSDLLLSIATAQWKKRDAREVMHQFVDEINNIGSGFNFSKDVVLKSCLVLSGLDDIRFKADNFNAGNMHTIENKWDDIAAAVRETVKLIADFGYNGKNLKSTNAIIPIAYFIHKNTGTSNIRTASKWTEARENIKQWLARVLLKGVFGAQTDSIYPEMRTLINQNIGKFPLDKIIQYYRGKRKSISFSDDEVENLLELRYGKVETDYVLTLIYPALNHNFRYHQDHIHPKSKFSQRAMKAGGFSSEQIEQFNAEANGIANLQLIEATSNIEKNDKPFKTWLEATYPEKDKRDNYLQQHHIDPNQSLEFEDFLDFIATRKATLKNLLVSTLGVTSKEET